MGIGIVIAVAVEDDLRAVPFRGLDLGNGSGLGHDDGGGNAEFVGGIGHTLGMVAGGGGNHRAGFAPVGHGGQLVAGTPDLEGTGLLAVFAF